VGSYFYLAPTLPTPVFGQKPPLGTHEFRGICGRSVEARKAGGLIGEYLFRELVLRNELVRLRGQRLDKDPVPYLREAYRPFLDPEPLQAAQRAFQAGNPLQGEVDLSRSLWAWLDGRTGGRVFDFDALAAYYLKLRVLERLQLFEEGRGAGEYDAVYRMVLAKANGVTA
jgi:hypothetical protein